MKVGVLALQGGFREHCEALVRLGVEAPQVRSVIDLEAVDALVIPGGESTAIGKLMSSSGLLPVLIEKVKTMPVMGTCAGMILSAKRVEDGIADQVSLGLFDAAVRRNAIGSQQFSFEADVEVSTLEDPFTAVFIRPPVVESTDSSVEILATERDKPVLCAQGPHLFATFHPELSGDDRIHRLFLERF